ncbi:hypothetical protein [Heyndrickxia coagulans]|uniref:hypothetical protein n=1 Tax=Heyndrickxia coagulans TaxID=1398 RepID=UPI0005A17381|nr:hypothetical protein [Heyndrickxia coagulans]
MAYKDLYFKKKFIPLSHQIAAMEKLFPEFRLDWKMNSVIWTGSIQPTPLNKRYDVQIVYSLDMRQPEVTVLDPELKKRDNEDIPHVYPGNKLCLFRPKKKEWTKNEIIANTIIPWISLWLYYYEIWHATGEWLGGGEHVNVKKRKRIE